MKHNLSILDGFIPVSLLHENPFVREKIKGKRISHREVSP